MRLIEGLPSDKVTVDWRNLTITNLTPDTLDLAFSPLKYARAGGGEINYYGNWRIARRTDIIQGFALVNNGIQLSAVVLSNTDPIIVALGFVKRE